jgi:hypothetical protein
VTVLHVLLAVLVICAVCSIYLGWVLYRLERRVKILETVLGQFGPAVESRIQESSTKVNMGEQWYEEMDEVPR